MLVWEEGGKVGEAQAYLVWPGEDRDAGGRRGGGGLIYKHLCRPLHQGRAPGGVALPGGMVVESRGQRRWHRGPPSCPEP